MPTGRKQPARKRAPNKRAPKSLARYAQKRDFGRTSEPQAIAPSGAAAQAEPEFVVQKHAARRLHYDLRLELDGVLKSWAVTRGPSLTVGEKRLAVRTEDHPIDYLDFEGNIPKGEYGGGSMIVWDRGRWRPEGDPHRGFTKGHLAFVLEGARLKGRWHLVRMRPRRGEKAEPWLLIKSDDEFARQPGDPEITEEATSQLSGRTNDELAAEGEVRADHKARAKAATARKIQLPDVTRIAGARKGLLPTFVEPSLAGLCDKPPRGPEWIHEIKYDGYRIQARIDARKVQLLTRKGLDWTDRFSSIADAVRKLGFGSALLDGEIVVEDDSGVSSFMNLQADLQAGRKDRFCYVVFDLFYLDGFDLTKAALRDRKAVLQQILAGADGVPVRFSEHLEVDGPTMLEHSCRLGLEGIISKRKDAAHRPGRSDQWLKSKCVEREELIVVGYVPSTVASRTVGALVLGYYDRDKLRYAGRVGTGWSGDQARSLRDTVEKLVSAKPRFANALPAGADKGVRWAEPKLVVEVEHRGWTRDLLLRAASFKGLREDRPAEEIVLEAPPRVSTTRHPDALSGLTHPERILWPVPGITKQGLAEFYVDIADWVLPHLVGRPLSLLRCPSGTGAKCFFAKHPWQGLSDGIELVEAGAKMPMLAIGGLSGLIGLIQAGVVEIHPWGSAIKNIEQPDRLIFDLDPGERVPWDAVIAGAKEIRDRLRALGLESFVKTSGGKGLHVVVPITPRAGWDAAKEFTGAIAGAMASDSPKRYVATMAKTARPGRIFVDYFRNGRGATAVAPYSTRASSAATVSTPLAWDELSNSIKADHFKVDNLRQRLDFLKSDPWDGFFGLRQKLP